MGRLAHADEQRGRCLGVAVEEQNRCRDLQNVMRVVMMARGEKPPQKRRDIICFDVEINYFFRSIIIKNNRFDLNKNMADCL